MKYLRDLELRHKLMIAMLVPILGLLWFGQSELRRVVAVKAESERLLVLAEMAVAASAMVHELQKERGMSAGYLGSAGQRFTAELPVQHEPTNAKVAALQGLLADFDTESFGADFAKQLGTGMRALGELDGKRQQVLDLEVSVADGIAYYTATNKVFLDLIGYIPKLSSIGAVANDSAAYSAFLQSIERAGIERAVLANVFAKDRFEPNMYSRFSELVFLQDVYIDQFLSLASDTNRSQFEAAMTDPKIAATERFRSIANDRATSGGFGVDPAVWFAAQTQKIEILKAVEDQLSASLRSQGIENRNTAVAELSFAIGVVAVSTIAAAVLAWLVVSNTLALLGAEPTRLSDVMNAIAAGDLDEDLQIDRPATGVYAAAQTMQTNLRARADEDRRAIAENGRIRQALNNVDGNILIADSQNHIVYANDAIVHLLGSVEDLLRQQIPGFSRTNLESFDFDILHRDCSFETAMLGELQDSTRDEMELAGLTIETVANPVFGEQGERLGTVLEWRDRTREIAAEREVQDIVQRALDGELTARIELQGKDGFFATLAERVNHLLETSEHVIGDTGRVLAAVAQGDLTKTIESDYAGAYQTLKKDANATVAKLTEVATNIQIASNSVRTGSGEISDGNSDLSQRTEQQASSLEETASSMEEMTSSVRQNADNAAEANQLALAARDQAKKGGEVVSAAVDAMSEINASSRKIADIIGVIDEIAFQTNLLALNASVEAARAGEQGRGFAVVASEVRNLASRSATAAKEIKDLIEDSGRKVEDGAKLVNESGETLTDIVTGVSKVTDIVGEIAAASREQSSGIEQVNTAISQMDELTQQNAALVEEAAAASESLSGQADDLNQLMSFFRVSESFSAHEVALAPVAVAGERRAANRPWSESPENAPLAFGSAATVNGADAQWDEF